MKQDLTKPYIDPRIQQKLTDIGGLVPFGEYAGQPKIKIVWGPDERRFAHGKIRPRWAEIGQNEWLYKRWYVSPELLSTLSEWTEENRPNSPNPAEPLRLSTFFETASPLEYKVKSDTLQEVIPEGWILIADINEFRQQLQPFWFVIQWVSPDQLFDTPQTWNAQRWDIAYCPEIRAEAYLDCLGPFPSGGDYQHVVIKLFKEVGDEKVYVEPTFENVVVPVQQMVQARDAQSRMERELEERTKKFFLESKTAAEKANEKDWQTYDDICDDLTPAFANSSAWVPAPKKK